MASIRINELARELEIKSKAIQDFLPDLGITEKRSHSSTLEDDLADKVRAHFRALASVERAERPAPARPSASTPPSPPPAVAAPTASEPAPAPAPTPKPAAPPRPASAPLTRSLAEIKAAARKAIAPPSAIHEIQVKPGIAAPSRSPAPSAPAKPAEPPQPHVAHSAPTTEIGEKLAAAAKLAGVSAPASSSASAPPKVARPARPAKSSASNQPIYPAAGMPRGIAGRPAAPRRPGEPRPMHPTATRPASASQNQPVTARPVHYDSRPHAVAPARSAPVEAPKVVRTITLSEGISIKELSEKLEVRAKDVIKRLLDKGVFATINQTLDSMTASGIARAFGAETKVVSFEEEVEQEVEEADRPEDLVPRAPVVTVMGHVDHGKTSLLDAIRETSVAAGEAGGITQHIGAYQVEVNHRKIVFLDTPGHEAFTLMRARGAKVTDVVVLVVAADDGVMPQTLEAIDHAKAAKVPILVAINKVDKPEAQPERVLKQLADRGLMPEAWGGDAVMVEVSAKQHKNLELLLEMILLVADMQSLKANPKRLASGAVLEAKLDRGRGPVATVLVENGTLHVGDSFIVGAHYGKVRAMFDDHGSPVLEAPPSTPVEVLGLEDVPLAGDHLQAIEDTMKARQISLHRQAKLREAALAKSARLTLEQLHEQMAAGEVKELPLIIKADVQGSVEVLADTLTKLSNDRVKTKMIHAGVGAITESDVLLASASNAVIVGFSVRPERKATELAQLEKVDIRLHTIIYNVTEEIKKAMNGLLAAVFKETVLGRAEVRETFHISKVGTVAGCYMTEGKINREAKIRLLRDNVVVYEGRPRSLHRFKDDVPEVRNGMECGIALENFSDVKTGDVLEAFVVERVMEPAVA